jgi:hypothetical protein
MLKQFGDSEEEVCGLSSTPHLSTIQQTWSRVSYRPTIAQMDDTMTGSTFDFCEDDATLLWLDGRGIESARILEHLRLIQVEQRAAVLVLLVEVHLLQSHQRTARGRVE